MAVDSRLQPLCLLTAVLLALGCSFTPYPPIHTFCRAPGFSSQNSRSRSAWQATSAVLWQQICTARQADSSCHPCRPPSQPPDKPCMPLVYYSSPVTKMARLLPLQRTSNCDPMEQTPNVCRISRSSFHEQEWQHKGFGYQAALPRRPRPQSPPWLLAIDVCTRPPGLSLSAVG